MKIKLLLLILIVSVSLTAATKDINRTQPPDYIYMGCCEYDTGWPLVVKTDFRSQGRSEYHTRNLALNFLFYILISTIVVGTTYKIIHVIRK
jgi:hypothetical protein